MVGAWLRLLVNSAVVAAVAVAAQLGAGDALGIIHWDGPHDARAWSTLLTWLAFSFAVAVLAGAMVGRIAVRRHDRDGVGSRVTASVFAAAGAAATIGLAWLPAQSLDPPTNMDPGLVVSLTAGAGVLVGLVLALLALAARPVAVGLQAMASWLWLIAIGAATAGVASDEPFLAPRLGVPDAPTLLPDSPWTGPRVMIIVAVVVGALVSGIARWRGSARLGAALAGLGGPALAAAAYLVADPTPTDAAQTDAFRASLVAAGAGLVASVLAALPGRRRARVKIRPGTAAPPVSAAAPVTSAPLTPAAATVAAPLTGDIIEVARATASPVTAQGRARPAWAEASGAYARAYSGGGVAREPATAIARGTGWDADSLSGTGAAGRHAEQAETGLYRSTSTTDADEDRPEPWLPDLRASGRHAALD